MPIYEFSCENCGPFEQRRGFSQASEPIDCPTCQTPATRLYSAPGLYKTSQTERIARYRNEKSAHEPRVEQRVINHNEEPSSPKKQQHHHHPMKRHEPHRPWMIGH